MAGRGRVTATSAAILALMFVTGVLVGRAWDVGSAEAQAAETTTEASEGEERGERTPMYEQVGITDGQRVVIDSLVVHYRRDMRTLQRDSRTLYDQQSDALADEVRAAIKAVMTPEQVAEYDVLLEASDERRRARRAERDREDGNDED